MNILTFTPIIRPIKDIRLPRESLIPAGTGFVKSSQSGIVEG